MTFYENYSQIFPLKMSWLYSTTRLFLSIHSSHLSSLIPCSYRTLACSAVLSSCITSYEISVRQTRNLPMSQYLPYIQLPSDSRSPSTLLLSAISFPLPGVFGTLTRQKRAPLGAPEISHIHTFTVYGLIILFLEFIMRSKASSFFILSVFDIYHTYCRYLCQYHICTYF